jgi:hypothetical protein
MPMMRILPILQIRVTVTTTKKQDDYNGQFVFTNAIKFEILYYQVDEAKALFKLWVEC